MDDEGIYRSFVEGLDAPLVAQADDSFKQSFMEFLKYNKGVLPVNNQALADYLSKRCNASQKLELPHWRFKAGSVDDLLKDVIGLSSVKQEMRRLATAVTFDRECAAKGRELLSSGMHMVFRGNPGTGKTMMADKVSHLLFGIGVIKQDKVVSVSAKDLIAGYVGQTAPLTAQTVQSALDGVLFIDEAYALVTNPKDSGSRTTAVGKEAIAELVKDMDQYRDRLVVIFAGYDSEMNELINVNPGLKSRIKFDFHFEDYTTQELVQIFELLCRKDSDKGGRIGLTEDARAELAVLFGRFRRFKGFGNGRFVNDVFAKAVSNYAQRTGGHAAGGSEGELFTLTAEDIPTPQQMMGNGIVQPEEGADKDDPFEGIVGLAAVKQSMRELKDVIAYEKSAPKGLNLPLRNLCMVFKGNPGTGKTTVARIVARILAESGVLLKNEVIEARASDIVGYGDAAERMREKIDEAMGGVLFIDEAYALMMGAGSDAAIAALVQEMEEQVGNISIILSGYSDQIQQLIERNPGLASRIGYTFEFEDYDADALDEIFKEKVRRIGFEPDEGALRAAHDVFETFQNVRDFGNGRFVDRLIDTMIGKLAAQGRGASKELSARDIPTKDDMYRQTALPIVVLDDEDLEKARLHTAEHEAGHALVLLELLGESDISKITIKPEANGTMGYVARRKSSRAIQTSEDFIRLIAGTLGGMAAEKVCEGITSSGVSSDLAKATEIARSYVAVCGMSEAGLVSYRDVPVQSLPADARAAIRNVLGDAYDLAIRTITDNRRKHEAMVGALLERVTMTGDELAEVWRNA